MIYLGVSACFMYPDPSRTVFGPKTLAYLEQDMARFLSQKDVMPILIPDLPEKELYQFLLELDGFVFQGGSDVAPETYRESKIEKGQWPGDSFRDQYELKIMDFAFKNKKPILAICRGFQLANVYFGGSLYQDLKLLTGTEVEHRNAEKYDRVFHEILCADHGLIKNIYGKETLIVNSVHHQGIKTLGKGLVVDAVSSEDQLIEAFHHKDLESNYLVGVQWHPEFSHTLGENICNPKPLMEHFLNAVRNQR